MRVCTTLADSMDYSSIKIYLSAVRSLHTENGLPDPLVDWVHLQSLLRGIKQVKGSSSPACLPVTIELMRVILQAMDLSIQDNLMLWAACCLGFFGFLRTGEFTVNTSFNSDIHMTVADVQADLDANPTFFKVHIKCSKTDPFRKDCDIYVGRGVASICPFVAISNYLEARGSESGPLFLYSDGSPLSRQKLTSTLQSILHSAGFTGAYSGYSFRRGAATTAASSGVPDHLVKTLRRSSSDAYELYSRTPVSSIVRVTNQLL